MQTQHQMLNVFIHGTVSMVQYMYRCMACAVHFSQSDENFSIFWPYKGKGIHILHVEIHIFMTTPNPNSNQKYIPLATILTKGIIIPEKGYFKIGNGLIFLSPFLEHGIHVDEAKFIRFISPGSVASNHPMLSVGDKILTVSKYCKHDNY